MYDRNELHKLASALGGLPVLACRADSPAARAGIRYGDIVMMVNDMPTPDWTSFIEARAQDGTAMRIQLFRDGELISLEIPLSTPQPVDTPTLLAELLAERIVPLSGGATLRKPDEPS